MEKNLKRDARIFNSPLEAGLRALILLNELKPQSGLDLQHIVVLDYILTHSGDIPSGPKSLHADIPHRASAIALRRKLLEAGLDLLVSRDLLLKVYSPQFGVTFKVSEISEKFLNYFESNHFANLVSRAKWVNQNFGKESGQDLIKLFNANMDRWNSEFSKESMERILE